MLEVLARPMEARVIGPESSIAGVRLILLTRNAQGTKMMMILAI